MEKFCPQAIASKLLGRNYVYSSYTEDPFNKNALFFDDGPLGTLMFTHKYMSVEEIDGEEVVLVKTKRYINSFNVETGEIREEIPKELWDSVPSEELSEFVQWVVSHNKWLRQALRDYDKNSSTMHNVGSIAFSHNADNKRKMWDLATKNLPLFEKLLKQNPDVFQSANAFSAIDVSEKNINKALGVPQRVIDTLNKKGYNFLVPYFKEVCDDGNDAVIIMDFIQNIKTLVKRRRNYTSELESIFKYLATAKRLDVSMTISEMLNYALVQTMYCGTWSLDGFKEVCQYFNDYTNMRVQWNIKERYPSNIFESHDLTSRNVRSYSNADESAFAAAVEPQIAVLEREITVNKGKENEETYSFIVPKTIKDLIAEGVAMHHCIGTWGKKIANGETRVVFMRKKDDIETSLATLEIDDSNKVVQAKIEYNEDLPHELELIVNAYERAL